MFSLPSDCHGAKVMDTPELTPILIVHCPVKASTRGFNQTGGAEIVTVALTLIILTN